MNGWVTGPVPLTTRTLDVYEGTVCVILHNGRAFDARGPGRHGGLLRAFTDDRNLPFSGTLQVLTFERAPTLSRPVTTEARLLDGATVEVTVTAAIAALWEDAPDRVLEVVRRHGVNPRRIEEVAELELEESLRVMVTRSLAPLTHAQVLGAADPRKLMALPPPAGLLKVDHLVSCTVTRDRHVDGAHVAFRDAELDGLRVQLDGQLARLRATEQVAVDAINRRAEINGNAELRVGGAQVDALIARMLGVPDVDVAFPHQRDARLQAKWDAVRGVLENNMDLLPLLAEAGMDRSTNRLADLVGGLFGDGAGAGAASHPPGTDQPMPALPTKAGARRLVRRAVAPSPSGPLEVMLVEGGDDQVLGRLGQAGPHRLVIADHGDPVDVSMRALSAAATWCGVQVGARVLNPATAEVRGRVEMTRVVGASGPGDIESSLGGWIAAINELLSGSVDVSVASAA